MFRSATVSDQVQINNLIRESKSFWGYSDAFLDAFMSGWGVKESYFVTNEIMLFEKEGSLSGLYAFKINQENRPELDLFFVSRNHIGQGIGKLMWQHLLSTAVEHGWSEFELIADPNAESFYEHMGAKTMSHYESFPGRFVPVMVYRLNETVR